MGVRRKLPSEIKMHIIRRNPSHQSDLTGGIPKNKVILLNTHLSGLQNLPGVRDEYVVVDFLLGEIISQNYSFIHAEKL